MAASIVLGDQGKVLPLHVSAETRPSLKVRQWFEWLLTTNVGVIPTAQDREVQ